MSRAPVDMSYSVPCVVADRCAAPENGSRIPPDWFHPLPGAIGPPAAFPNRASPSGPPTAYVRAQRRRDVGRGTASLSYGPWQEVVAGFRVVTEIAAPVEVCFDLSRSIDLHLESMISSGEQAVDGVTAGLIGAGEEVTWEARHLGMLWRMTSRITAFEPPHRFVDEMVHGPFAFFRHEHLFAEHGDGTQMTDAVEAGMGLGPLGPVADRAAVAYLKRLIRIRNTAIKARAEVGERPG